MSARSKRRVKSVGVRARNLKRKRVTLGLRRVERM